MNDNSKSELLELDITKNSPAVDKAIVQLKLPITSFVVMIHRKGAYLTATGDTIIQEGDHLLVMADNKETVQKVNERFLKMD